MRTWFTLIVLTAVSCSGGEPKSNNASSNNWINNGATNNGATNNGATNNNATNNGATNNGATNNGATNNGATNNGTSTPCPPTQPGTGDACTSEGLTCEWGDDPREHCRDRGTCTSGSWVIQPGGDCDVLPTVECPPTRMDAEGEACDPQDAICEYEDNLNCLCTNCTVGGPVEMCGGDPVWRCDAPNADPTCPPGKPRLGEACSTDAKSCVYSCGPEGGRLCSAGVWTAADGGPCPISTRRVKTDVHYLDAREITDLSRELQAIPLARWRYTDPSLGAAERLGFIIEDLPDGTPAVDRERFMVDLYGYTSMLVADAQAREKRMNDMERRLEALEQELRMCRTPSD